MKRVFLIIAALILLQDHAHASSPGMVEGPPGCDWEAVVEKVQPQPAASVELTLTKMHGRCMYEPSSCGEEGDLVFVPLGKNDAGQYQAGKTIHVWVDEHTATLTQPVCTKTPIPLPQNSSGPTRH